MNGLKLLPGISEPSSSFWPALLGKRGAAGEDGPSRVVKARGPVKEKYVIREKKCKGRITLTKKK